MQFSTQAQLLAISQVDSHHYTQVTAAGIIATSGHGRRLKLLNVVRVFTAVQAHLR